ncbi:MAG: SDR family oxidoreductase [Leptospirillum sp.]|jgi:dihydroflavonol-4-reductase
MKTVFVTGATGLLGNNLVRLLLDRGYHVRALVRDTEKALAQFSGLPSDRLRIVTGNIRNSEIFQEELKGTEILFHTAALAGDSYKGGKHWKDLYETNVLGTERLMETAHKAGIRNMVHISSIAVLGENPNGLVTEEHLQKNPERVDEYYRSKIEADARVYQFLKSHHDMKITLVLPGWIHGPGDRGPTTAGQFVLDYMNNKLPGVPDAALSFVDARDVAQVALAAAELGESGQRYLAAPYPIKMRDLFQAMERVSGKKAPVRSLPSWLLFGIAGIQEAYSRITGKPVLLSLAAVRVMGSDYGRQFSSEKVRREFDLTFRSVEETLADELAWFRENGYLA